MTHENSAPSVAQKDTLPAESLVSIAGGKTVADSRVVVEMFGKQHQHVLRSIDRLLAQLSQIDDTPVQNWTGVRDGTFGFAEKHVPHLNAPKHLDRYYEMDRDAFTLLAMSFTGAEARERIREKTLGEKLSAQLADFTDAVKRNAALFRDALQSLDAHLRGPRRARPTPEAPAAAPTPGPSSPSPGM